MAHDLVDRGTHAFGKTIVIERSRNSAVTNGDLVHPVVDLLRCHSRSDMFSDIIQHRDVDLAALFYFLDLLRCFDQLMIQNRDAF